MSDLFFIEYKKDVEKLELLRKKTNFQTVVLDPEAAYFLEKKNISFKVQDDYFSNTELIELGISNFKKTEDFCKFCDKFLQENITFLKENNLNVTFSHFHCFRAFFDTVASKFFLLKKVIDAEAPETIYFFDNNCEEEINERFYFTKKSSYSEVLKLMAKHYDIECNVYQTKDIEGRATYHPITDVSNSRNIIREVYRLLRKIYDGFYNKYKELPIVFMTLPGYDLSRVVKLIKNKKIARILSFDPESSADPYFIFPTWEKVKDINYNKILHEDISFNEIWQNLLRDKKFQEFFIFEGVNLFLAAEKKLEYFFTKFIIEIINLYLKGLELFKIYKPKIFLAPYMVRARMKMLAEAAKKNDIPVAVYQHGGAYGYYKGLVNESSETQSCDYFISFGSGVKNRFLNHKSKIIPVGSFILNDLNEKMTLKNKRKTRKKLGIKKDKKVILYVMTSMLKYGQYIDHNYYTDFECFNTQRKIIDVFAKHDGYQYIFKVFPLYGEKDPIVSYIKDRKKENFKVLWDTSFKKILPCADLIVMDIASTPLLEALTSRQKIIVYNLFKGMYPDAVEVLKKRAYYSENIDEYLGELDKELAKGDFEVKNPDNEFSELYGEYDDFEEIKNRAVSFLQDILK